MDNQQERRLTVQEALDIGWLAGMFDGEGSISMPYRQRHGRKPIYSVRAEIVNTDEAAIERVSHILHSYQVGCWIHTKPNATTSWKTTYSAFVIGLLRVKTFADLLLPHLTIKQERLQIAKEWIDYRLSLPSKSSHGERDALFAQQLSKLNQRGRQRILNDSMSDSPTGDEERV